MKALISLVTSFLLSFGAYANDFAAAVGVRSNSADAVTVGNTTTSKTGFGAGVMGFFDMSENVQIRSGFMYNQRNISIRGTGAAAIDEDLDASYIDIPVTAMYKFAEYGGAFAGPVLALLASKNCKVTGGCSKNPESMVVGAQFGVSFKFAPQLGAELYYELVPTEYWKGQAENVKTVGANLLFTFE